MHLRNPYELSVWQNRLLKSEDYIDTVQEINLTAHSLGGEPHLRVARNDLPDAQAAEREQGYDEEHNQGEYQEVRLAVFVHNPSVCEKLLGTPSMYAPVNAQLSDEARQEPAYAQRDCVCCTRRISETNFAHSKANTHFLATDPRRGTALSPKTK
jgi:hypothetical protein